MYTEDDLLPISALQHLDFCPRQCALIHLERIWQENFLTAQGRIMHDKVHDAGTEYSGAVRVAKSLRLRSLRLGLTGVADVVEFHRDETGVALAKISGRWRPYPVEYKRGKPKADSCDEVQLCAQALCLEEMLGVEIREGSLFYGQPRRRTVVEFDITLRNFTERCAKKLHELIAGGVTPKAEYSKKCDACSLVEECRPQSIGDGKSAINYTKRMITSD